MGALLSGAAAAAAAVIYFTGKKKLPGIMLPSGVIGPCAVISYIPE